MFSQIKYIKHILQDFHSDAWAMPQRWDLAVKNLFFLNKVMWHIKLEGMVSRTGHEQNFHPTVNLVKYH